MEGNNATARAAPTLELCVYVESLPSDAQHSKCNIKLQAQHRPRSTSTSQLNAPKSLYLSNPAIMLAEYYCHSASRADTNNLHHWDDDEGYAADAGTPPKHGNQTPSASSPDGPISTPEAARYLMDFLFPDPMEFPILLPDAPRYPTRAAAYALAAQYEGKPLNVWDAVRIANKQMEDEVVEGSVSGESVLVESSQIQGACSDWQTNLQDVLAISPLTSPKVPRSAHELLRRHNIYYATKLGVHIRHLKYLIASLLQKKHRLLMPSKVAHLGHEIHILNSCCRRLLRQQRQLLGLSRTNY